MKKVLLVLALGTLLFTLTGCLPDNDSANSNESSTNETLAEQAEEQSDPLEEEKVVPAVLEPCPVSFGETSYPIDSIGNEEFSVQITNNSDRPVKEVLFAVVFWDKDNLPIKVQFGYDEYSSFIYGNAMTPGETTSSNISWSIYNESGKDIVYSEILVREVIFFEGENWININFDMELAQYVGKLRKE